MTHVFSKSQLPREGVKASGINELNDRAGGLSHVNVKEQVLGTL